MNPLVQTLETLLREFECNPDEQKLRSGLNVVQDENDSYQQQLYHVLIKVLDGDQDCMNEWMFSLPINWNGVIVWLAKIYSMNEPRFVWMVGILDPETEKLRRLIKDAESSIKSDTLLTSPTLPPFLLYVHPIATSTWQTTEELPDFDGQDVSDYSVYQVPYTGDKPREDIDQLMPMNSMFLARQTSLTRLNMNTVCDLSLLNFFDRAIEPHSALLSKLHTELHNYGHFVGPWPYDQSKNSAHYEAVEEFRACLAAVAMISHLNISEEMKDAFALLVVCTRIFCLGLIEFLNPEEEKTRQSIREISVAVFFFEYLVKSGTTVVVDGLFGINISKLRPSLRSVLEEIHFGETISLNKVGQTGLEEMAISIYTACYPSACLSTKMNDLYSQFHIE